MGNSFDRLQAEAFECNTPGLKFELKERSDGSLIVRMSGHIDLHNASELDKITRRALAMGYVRLVFDWKDMKYICSHCDLFISIKRAALQRGGDVILTRVPERIKTIYDLVGFSSFFRFYNDIDDTTLTTAFNQGI